jgi:nucleotidyltransferase/DNA polymerase involved in DNA repair
MKPARAVGHLDADCFYVSAERVRDPFLVGKPVGVLGNQGACVIAKSYEMRAAGVTTGEPIWEALPKCPDGIYVKRDFRWYEVVSRKMLEVVREFSTRVEFYSIDEFFFRSEPAAGQSHQELAAAMRDRIWQKIGVPVTVGIARTRTLAKFISDAAKPFGAYAVFDPDTEKTILAGRPVTDITGIAGRRARRLEPWGVRTCLDLAKADRRLVRQVLTATGETLWWELNGDSVTPIHPKRPRHKVLSRGGSLGGESTADPAVLHAWLVRNLERLIEELHFHELVTARLSVFLSYKSGQAALGKTNLEVPSDRFDLLLDAGKKCLEQAYIPRETAVRMHLFAENLLDRQNAPLGLFTKCSERLETLARVKEKINNRHGRFALRSAATLPLKSIYVDSSNGYDICDIRGKICF